MTIRQETETDFSEIAALTRAAFVGEYEVELIEKLRAARLMIVSLVAAHEGAVVGHILFSELGVEVDGRTVKTAALAPMAVRPDRQRRGVGSSGVKSSRERIAEATASRLPGGHRPWAPRLLSSLRVFAFVDGFSGCSV